MNECQWLWRADCLLLKITPLLVADTAFSNLPFVNGLKEIGFSLISRLRSNAVLFYIYDGPVTGKRGRPKTRDGKIDYADTDKSKMRRLVIHYLPNGSHRLYFSTDTNVTGKTLSD